MKSSHGRGQWRENFPDLNLALSLLNPEFCQQPAEERRFAADDGNPARLTTQTPLPPSSTL